MNNIRDMGCTFQTASGYNATGVNTAANNTLDNSYYTANLQNMVLLKSDWELTTNGFAKGKAGGVQEQRRGLEQRLRQRHGQAQRPHRHTPRETVLRDQEELQGHQQLLLRI